MVAHIAEWQRLAADRLAALRRGEDLGPPEVDAINERVHAEAAERSWNEIAAQALVARQAYLAAVQAATPEVLTSRDNLGARIAGANGPFHYAEHMDDFVDQAR